MNQHTNIIFVNDNGVLTPYIILERLSEFAQITPKDGIKYIREQRRGETSVLVCRPIQDAQWTDIPTDGETEISTVEMGYKHIDRKV